MAEDDLRQFMRELLTRYDRDTEATVRRLDAGTAVLMEQVAQIRDMRAEIRAQTQAILHVLDELRGSNGPAPA